VTSIDRAAGTAKVRRKPEEDGQVPLTAQAQFFHQKISAPLEYIRKSPAGTVVSGSVLTCSMLIFQPNCRFALSLFMSVEMHEKRRFHRVRPSGLMPRTGTIYADLKSRPIVCDVVDVSAGGACLDVHGSDAIPKRFILHHGGVKKTCRIVWQKGRRIGVNF
jgi:hypothetical protein